MDVKIEGLLKQINTKYGANSVTIFDQEPEPHPIISSTGSLTLDLALGIKGIPTGRIMECYGPESSGKTTLCIHMLAEAQKGGKTVAFIDAEHAFDAKYAQAIGLDYQNLIFSQPDNGEHALSIVENLSESGLVDLIVIDSVAALVPKAELDNEMGEHSVGLHARLMSRAMRKLAGVCNKMGCTLVFINQLREKIGIMYGSPEVTTGGNALKFWSSIRLDIRKIGFEEHSEKGRKVRTANKTRVKVIKNKLAAPFKECEFDIEYGHGIVRESELIQVGLELGLLIKATRNKKNGIYTEFPSPNWPFDKCIETTESYASDILKETEFWYLKEELDWRIQQHLGFFDEAELKNKLDQISVKFQKIESEWKEALDATVPLTSSSKWKEAYPFIKTAYDLKPFDKYTKQRFQAIEKKYLDIIEEEKIEAVNRASTGGYKIGDKVIAELQGNQIEAELLGLISVGVWNAKTTTGEIIPIIVDEIKNFVDVESEKD